MSKVTFFLLGVVFTSVLPFSITDLKDQSLKAGRRTEKIQPRISDGGGAYQGQFPFAAHLHCNLENGTSYLYGGVLVTNQWILTTADCAKLKPHSVSATLGTIARSSPEGKAVHATRGVVHNSLVLFELKEQISEDDDIRPIEYLDGFPVDSDEYVVTLGWGRTIAGGNAADFLMYVYLKTMTNTDCDKYYYDITDELVCANGTNFEGLCGGDMGGPLFYYGESGAEYLVGISHGVSGCGGGYPSVFVRTENYLPWIYDVTGKI